MDEPDLNCASAVRQWARVDGGATALVYEDSRTTYRQLDQRIDALAAVLGAGGVRRGDRVAWLGRNSAMLLCTALATLRLGAVFVPLNFRLTAGEVRDVLEDCGVHSLLAEADHAEALADAGADRGVRRRLLVDTDPFAPRAATVPEHWQPLSAASARTDAPPPAGVAVAGRDTGLLIYTSGSTGRPKGVALSHGNLWWHDAATSRVIDTRLRDTALVVAPMFHIAGLSGFTLGTLAHGGTVVLRRAFEPALALDDLVTHRVANLIGVPAIYDAIAQVPGFATADLSALRTAVVGGAPVPSRLAREYAARGVVLRQAWGMTETAPLACIVPAELALEHPDAAGHSLPYTAVRLSDPATGVPVTAPDTDGEIWVRGPQVFHGYWNNADATRQAIDEAGWFRSGDIGRLDGQGLLYVVGRIKDVIISGGENIYPAEIENVLADCPGVREAAVVAMPHSRWTETPVAVVCPEGGEPLSTADVRAFAEGRLARYKTPTAVILRDTLPRNGSGKVDKPALRAWLLAEGTTGA
ncbi:AMP-binding protein [Streptomyces sp. NPDC094466]|uniref:AMP-binding protein n=1 Tax=Streptomyces sp. NPDC094466 TaxID=3366065 RepID=UPI0037F8E9E5